MGLWFCAMVLFAAPAASAKQVLEADRATETTFVSVLEPGSSIGLYAGGQQELRFVGDTETLLCGGDTKGSGGLTVISNDRPRDVFEWQGFNLYKNAMYGCGSRNEHFTLTEPKPLKLTLSSTGKTAISGVANLTWDNGCKYGAKRLKVGWMKREGLDFGGKFVRMEGDPASCEKTLTMEHLHMYMEWAVNQSVHFRVLEA